MITARITATHFIDFFDILHGVSSSSSYFISYISNSFIKNYPELIKLPKVFLMHQDIIILQYLDYNNNLKKVLTVCASDNIFCDRTVRNVSTVLSSLLTWEFCCQTHSRQLIRNLKSIYPEILI